MPQLWVKAGDIASAQKAADLIQVKDDTSLKSAAQWGIAKAQVKAGDIAGAQKTADLIQYAFWKSAAMEEVAKAQAEAGDIAGAQKTADLIQDARQKSWAQFFIARAQAEVGDIAGAQKTADLIQGADDKRRAQSAIAAVQAKAGIANAPNSTRQSTSDTQPPIQPAITVSDWLKKLDDDNKKNDCPLNTERFLDLAGYLKSLPPPDYPDQVFVWGSAGRVGPLPRSGDPRRVLESLYETAEKIVDAQNVIRGMLKQQAKR